MLSSFSNVGRALGLDPKKVRKVVPFYRVLWVWVEGCRPKFMSLRQFWTAFVSFRKTSAHGSIVTRIEHTNFFDVLSAQGKEWHSVALYDKHLECSCKDYQNQIINPELQFYGVKTLACKHIYAVIQKLGYASLAQYIKR